MTVRRSLVLGVLLLAAFVALGVFVSGSPGGLDSLLGDLLHDRWRGPAGVLAEAVSAVLGPVLPVLFAVALAIGALVLWRRGERDSAGTVLRVLVLLVLCRATSWLAKPVFERERPRVYPDFSYPSGHVVSVASTGVAAVVLCTLLAAHLVTVVTRVAVVSTLLCAASRVVLDVHWLTDTVGAVLAVSGVGLLSAVALRLLPPVRRGVASSA
ncbi:phosphatidic acid phosphatase [Prauserella sp. PE36]|uniref:Phosphatidic acid phosphatase n=1 Tax=Prauserella endophytica TaxID=1592324 RepID=A0ABY2S6A0_9PSEU|nr:MULTISPECIES: phosphatase PAP2 family protein [Prauserella]PXY21674.1 phosphatidic acid phosphatase [Prauserella coralliicola]RBM20049.1 phosphatidic acid phosphatase [Prauserella sp. PE36]TKG71454.1 phosphatidic acid phosphatase [Prauserella endophytica]